MCVVLFGVWFLSVFGFVSGCVIIIVIIVVAAAVVVVIVNTPELLQAINSWTYTMVIHSKATKSFIHHLGKWKVSPGHMFGYR